MKKIIASLTAASLAFGGFHASAQAPTVEDISLSMTSSFESEYIFRGFEEGRRAFQPSVQASLPVVEGTLYGEVWSSQPLEGSSGGTPEINLITGYSIPVELVTVDFGFTYYWYPERDVVALFNRQKEIYLGGALDTIANPAVYIYHNFSLDAWIAEAEISHDLILTDFATLELKALAGTAKSSDFNSDQSPGSPNESWNYYELTADVVYALNDVTDLSIGGRYSKIQGEPNDYLAATDKLWWGASISMGF